MPRECMCLSRHTANFFIFYYLFLFFGGGGHWALFPLDPQTKFSYPLALGQSFRCYYSLWTQDSISSKAVLNSVVWSVPVVLFWKCKEVLDCFVLYFLQNLLLSGWLLDQEPHYDRVECLFYLHSLISTMSSFPGKWNAMCDRPVHGIFNFWNEPVREKPLRPLERESLD